MKYRNKLMVFFLSLLFSYGIDTFGYTYTITNMTGRDVMVRLDYAFGTLNKQADLVEKYDTREFLFGGWKAGLCLTKIMVSIKKLGKWEEEWEQEWEEEKEAKVGIIEDADRFKELKESGLIGKLLTEGIKLFGLSKCKSRHFVLVRDRASKEVYAITDIDI